MAGGYQVGITSETKAFKQGIDAGVIEPLEDAQKELLELGRNRGPMALEESLKDAQDASEKLADETKRTADAIEREYRDSYRKMRQASENAIDGGRAGMSRLRDGAQEVTQEVGQNLGEAVSSIRGDLTDLGQVGQDTLGGLAATLASTGPAGIAGAAVLAAGAVGLGAVTAELQKQQEGADKFRDRISDVYRSAAEDGRTFIDEQSKISAALDILFDPERADDLKQAQEDSARLGIDLSRILAAQTGDMGALSEVQSAIAAVQQKALQNTNLAERWDADLTDLYGRWESIGQVTDENARKAVTARQITSDYLLDAIAKADTATEEVDEFGNRLIHLPDGKDIIIDAKTGQASENLAKFKGDADGVIDHVNGRAVVIKARVDTSDADRSLIRFINQGRQIKIGSRIVGPAGNGGWN